MIGDEEMRRLVMRHNSTDRPECRHVGGHDGSTLTVTYNMQLGLWFCACTRCKRWTEACLTKSEAVKRAEMGWWAL